MKKIVTTAFILSLTACASLSQDQCMNADWYQLGRSDGEKGYSSTRLSKHRKACAKHGLSPDTSDYSNGRKKGLLYYCTADNGLSEGLKGKSYRRVCPLNLEKKFLAQYEVGKGIYNLEKEIKEHRRKISSIERNIKADKKKSKLSKAEITDYKHDMEILEVRIEEKQKRLYHMKGQAGVSL